MMITEAEIINKYKYVLVDDVYLFASLAHEEQELGMSPANIIYTVGGCPYCGCPCRKGCDRSGPGPGGWSYDRYRCGTNAAVRLSYPIREGSYQAVLLAISKQTSMCQLISLEVGQSASSDDII